MSPEKQMHPPEMQVQKSAEPAKVVGMRYVLQSTLYDWTKILSIVPAKIAIDTVKGFITSQKDFLGDTLWAHSLPLACKSVRSLAQDSPR